MFFTLFPEVKHVVPNDLFETNLPLRFWYTMDAADYKEDQRMQIPSAAKSRPVMMN
jgi:hypothetical protein